MMAGYHSTMACSRRLPSAMYLRIEHGVLLSAPDVERVPERRLGRVGDHRGHREVEAGHRHRPIGGERRLQQGAAQLGRSQDVIARHGVTLARVHRVDHPRGWVLSDQGTREIRHWCGWARPSRLAMTLRTLRTHRGRRGRPRTGGGREEEVRIGCRDFGPANRSSRRGALLSRTSPARRRSSPPTDRADTARAGLSPTAEPAAPVA